MPNLDIATLGINVDARQVKDGDRALDNFERTARRTDDTSERLNRTQARLAAGIKAVGVALAALELVRVARELYEAAAAAERLRMAMSFSFGASVGKEMQYVTKLAHDLGLEFASTAQAYQKLSAAARGTSLAGEGARSVFEAVSKAAVVMGLSTEQTAGALTALEQMISKGTVSSEELKGQLGERIPGAFQIAARAMGKTTQELQKMLEQGEVLAEDFLPKFARQLDKELGDSAEKAADRLDAATNRMANAFKRLMTAVAESGIADFLKSLVKGASVDMTAISDAMEAAKTRGAGTIGQLNAGAGMAIGRVLNLQRINDDFKTFDGRLESAKAKIAELDAKPSLTLWERSDLATARATVEEITAIQRAREGAANDSNAQDARLMASGKVITEQQAAQAKGAAELVDLKRKAFGVDKDYLPTLEKYQKQLAAGNLTQREYVDLVTELAKANYKKTDADKAGESAAKKSAADYAQRVKDAGEYLVKLEQERHLVGATAEQQTMVAAAAEAAKAPTEALRLAIMQKALALTVERTEQEKLDAARKSTEAHEAAMIAGHAGKIEQSRQTVDALRKEVETYGMGAAAIARYNLAQLEKRRFAVEAGGDPGDLAELEALIAGQKQIEQLANKKDDLDKLFNADKIETFGEALREAFTGAKSAAGQMANAVGGYFDKQKKFEKERKKATLEYGEGSERASKAILKINAKEAEEKIQSYAEITGAAKGFFSEQTVMYKALTAVEQTFRLIQIAGAIQAMYVDNAETANSVKNSTVKTAASTTAGAAKIFEQLGIWGFVGVAAMLAVMASLGGKGGSASAPSLSEQRQDTQGTGTVLGNEGAKSESLSKALDIVAENTHIALDFSSRMLGALRNIEAGIANMAATVSRSGFLRGSAQSQKALGVGSKKGFLGWGDEETTLDDSGIMFAMNPIWKDAAGGTGADNVGKWAAQTIGEVLTKGFNLVGFSDLTHTESNWFGSDSDSERRTEAIDPKIAKMMNRTMANIVETILIGGGALGKDTGAMAQIINSLKLSDLGIGKEGDPYGEAVAGVISLKGLSGAESGEEIAAVLSAMSDVMVERAIPELEAFGAANEGAFETLARVVSGVDVATFELEKFGITAINWKDVINKQGDVGAEIVRQSIVNAERAGNALTGVGEIMQYLDGTATELAETYAELRLAQDSLAMVGIDRNALGRSMIRGAGSVGDLQGGLDTYFENYFTEAEQLAAKTENMRGKFAALGLEMPTSIEGFRALADGIPKTTAEGQRLFGQTILLAEGFADLHDGAEEAAEKIKELAKQRRQLEIEEMELSGDKVGALAATRALELAEIDKTLHPLKERIYKLQDEAEAYNVADKAASAALAGLRKSLDAEKKLKEAAHKLDMEQYAERIEAAKKAQQESKQLADATKAALGRLNAPGQEATRRADAQATIAAAAAIANAGGRITLTDDLNKALTSVTEPADGLFESFVDYQRDFFKTAIDITNLNTSAEKQLGIDERTLLELESQKKAAELAHAEDIARLDALYTKAQEQIDATKGVDTSVKSVDASLAAVATALAALRVASATTGGSAAAGGGTALTNAQKVQGLYAQIAGRVGEAEGVKFWTDALNAGASYDTIAKDFQTAYDRTAADPSYWADVAAGKYQMFANGGYHSGGWRVVGEQGPELAYTGPEHIVSNPNSRDLLDNEPVVEAVKELTAVVHRTGFAIANNTSKTADNTNAIVRDGVQTTAATT